MLASTELISEDFSERQFNEKKIKRIIELLKEEQELPGFLYRVDVCNRFKKFLGFYSFQDRHLIINLNGIQHSYDRFLKENNIRFGSAPSIRHYNIMVTNTILHELAHATQAKEAVKPQYDTIHQIVKEGLEIGVRSPYQISPYKYIFTRLFYNDILIERQAEFSSLYSMLKRNEETGYLSERETLWLEKKLLGLIAHGYGKHHTPVSKYYTLRGKYNEYHHLPLTEDYSLEERLSWGLPVDHTIISTVKEGLKSQESQLKLILK